MLYLCVMKKKTNSSKIQSVVKRPIDSCFEQMDADFAVGNKMAYAVFLALAFFGIMGLIWMIPFPQFQFLINMKMHTFLNWGSLFIAIVVYVYLKLAPTLSYAALLSIAVMSFFIVQLEYVERDGGPTVVFVCSIIAFLGLIGLFLQSRKEGNISIKHFLQFLGLGPIWLWSKVFDKFKIKY